MSIEQEFSITTIQDNEIESDELAILNIESINDLIYSCFRIIDDDEPIPSIENKNNLNEVFPNPAKDIINLTQ